MTKKLYKILEFIGVLVIFMLLFKLFPYFKNIIKFIFKIGIPFLIAFTTAFIFEPLIERLENKKVNRKITITILTLFFLIALILISRFVIPNVIVQTTMVVKRIPEFFDNLSQVLEKINQNFQNKLFNFSMNYDKIEEFLITKITTYLTNITSFLQKTFSYVISILITPILTIYFMNDYKKIENNIKQFLIKKNKNYLYDIFSKIKESVRQYVKGVLFVMVVFTLVASLVFMFIGLDYAFLFGIVIGITDIIPYLGPYIGGGIVVLFTLISSPSKVLIVLLSIVVLQFLESNLLVPKIQSKTMNTNPILVILSVAFFGELLGIFGMLIAVPMEKIIEIIINSYQVNKKK